MTTLTLASLTPLVPVLVMSGSAVLLMLLISFVRSHLLTLLLGLTAVVAAMASMSLVGQNLPAQVTLLIYVDGSTHFYWSMILLSTLVCIGVSHAYVRSAPSFREEWYLLLLVAACGGMVLAASSHMAALFIGLELMSVPLYGLAAFALKNKRSLEAGIKYLVLSATASAFLLFGIALIYAETGSLLLAQWASLPVDSSLGLLGCAMILIGLGFKLSWVPFHTWTPDVYQGAPMPVTAFLATASKVAVVAVLVRLFIQVPLWQDNALAMLLALVGGASILLGNLLAISQTSLKRLLAYSSIAHFGYLMIALTIVAQHGSRSVWVYLATYVIATLSAFAVLSSLTGIKDDTQGDRFEALRGLYQRNPLLALALALSLISMAGIPLTAGFVGKFALFASGVASGQWVLLLLVVAGSAIGIYYYLRVVSVLFQRGGQTLTAGVNVPTLNGILIAALSFMTLAIGIWPDFLI
ncbi:MAG: NADH-quinone oxidoreductase subunit N [Gammaproteobacteria bacterium]|nr:NADH-quinone oxidoreductase subunit N [Gammaproteobacteria bacterium]